MYNQMNLISMYTIPAVLLVVFTFVIMFIADKIHTNDTNKVVFVVFTEIIVNILQISVIRLFS